MHLIKDAFYRYVMNHQTMLSLANRFMLFTLLLFIVSVALAYGYETSLPMMVVAVLHVLQLVLAGVFKVAYVVRLVAQKQLGLTVA